MIEPLDVPYTGSARNHLSAEIVSITNVGGRVRLGLSAGQPLIAEVSEAALGARPPPRACASPRAGKAAATRLVASG